MPIGSRVAALVSFGLVSALLLFGAVSAPLEAQSPSPPSNNVVQINIVNGEIRVTNRGLGLCKSAASGCPAEIVWRWAGGDPNSEETEKIVISYVKGTNEAYDCFQDAGGNPRLYFEILERQSQVAATVSAACPAKSAWLYQISCVRTDPGHEGVQCTDIPPVDPGVVIG